MNYAQTTVSLLGSVVCIAIAAFVLTCFMRAAAAPSFGADAVTEVQQSDPVLAITVADPADLVDRAGTASTDTPVDTGKTAMLDKGEAPAVHNNGAELEHASNLVHVHDPSVDRETAYAKAAPSFVKPDKPTVYLTFDDGPSGLTPKILDILKKEGISATFFVLGNLAEARSDTIKRIVEEGHSLGNHTYNHVYSELYASYKQFQDQVTLTEQILDRIVGVRPQLIRAPGGTHRNFDAYYFEQLQSAGYMVHDWNVDSGDSSGKRVTAAQIINNVKNSKLRNEMTVLLHDGSGHEETVKAMPEIIRYFQNLGYTFAPLTPEVEPVTFPVAATIKWDRPIVTAESAAIKDSAKPSAAPGVESSLHPELLLSAGQNEVRLHSGQYEMKNDRLYVPLRALVQAMGGKVTWDAGLGEAAIRIGGMTGRYKTDSGKLTLTSEEGKKSTKQLDWALVQGEIIVPLREAVTLLGQRIGEYRENAQLRVVKINNGLQ